MTSSVAGPQADATRSGRAGRPIPAGLRLRRRPPPRTRSRAPPTRMAAAQSIWDTFSHTPGRTRNGETGDVACDHYHRWHDDIALMRELGIGVVSVQRELVARPAGRDRSRQPAWPRLLRLAGRRAPGRAGSRHCRRSTTGTCRRRSYDRGGWTNPEAPAWFAEYAGVMARRLGDRVPRWLTLNEPQVFAFAGHAYGRHAPGMEDWPTALRVADGALRGPCCRRGADPGDRAGRGDRDRAEPESGRAGQRLGGGRRGRRSAPCHPPALVRRSAVRPTLPGGGGARPARRRSSTDGVEPPESDRRATRPWR